MAEAAAQVTETVAGSERVEALLRAARRGDPGAFMALLALERPRLESLAYRLLDDGADVGDVMQEVYLSASFAEADVPSGGNFGGVAPISGERQPQEGEPQ